MGPDTAFGNTHVGCEPGLPRKTEIVLPGIAQQHGEGDLVAGTELLRFQQEVWELREAHGRGGVCTAQDYVFIPHKVADSFAGRKLHIAHYTPN